MAETAFPSLMCSQCSSGFRRTTDLQRHRESHHQGRAWICVDPRAADTLHEAKEGRRPAQPLAACNRCKEQWPYSTEYGAAQHLRRIHFCPRKQDRNVNDQDWPDLAWLRSSGWLKRIKVGYATREGSVAAGTGQGEQATSNKGGQKRSFHHAEERSMKAYQQHAPHHRPLFDAGNAASIIDAVHETSIPTANSGTSVTMQHWPLNTLHQPWIPLSMQRPMQTPHTTHSLDPGPVLSSYSNENYDRESTNSSRTIPDEELLLEVASVSRVTRFNGRWFVDVDYEESLFPKEYFAQILYASPALSQLAETAWFDQGECRVHWRSETLPLARARLRSDYTDLVRRLDILCPNQDVVEWHAWDSAYVTEGSREKHRLCLCNGCQSCVSIFAPIPPQVDETWSGWQG